MTHNISIIKQQYYSGTNTEFRNRKKKTELSPLMGVHHRIIISNVIEIKSFCMLELNQITSFSSIGIHDSGMMITRAHYTTWVKMLNV